MREVLEGLPRDVWTVFLIGPTPAPGWRSWGLEGLAGSAWAKDPRGDYLEGATPVLRYVDELHGRRVEIQHANAWFMGAGTYTAADATTAWAMLATALPRRFPGAILWNTPAATGRDLWLRKIQPGRAWPVLPDELRELVSSTTGQGRIELVAHDAGEIEGLYEYDGRLMYAPLACALPAGIPTWERGDQHAYDEHARGRYRVRATVPRDWPHRFGLLGIKHERENWRYPNAPGEQFETWAEGSELRLAFHAGWSIDILEALVWPPYQGKGPLDSWANALIATRDEFDRPSRPELAEPCRLVRAALRSIVLHTIGSLAARTHKVTHYAATPEDLPAEYRRKARPEPAGGFTYPVELPAVWKQMQHPELAQAVWGKARARLLAGPGRVGALHASSAVLAFRTDAIYTTGPESWLDSGRAGAFRLKRSGTGPFPTPRTGRELLELRGRL